jgi:sortase A
MTNFFSRNRFSSNRWKNILSALLLLLVIWQWGQAGWIYAKAQLAQYLIQNSWQTTLVTQTPQKPWAWADTWPVARLQAPGMNKDLYILEGADGSALAFGPGHMQGTALPGQGASVIGGHRDTHFDFLADAKTGDPLRIQDLQGKWKTYQIDQIKIVDGEKQPLQIEEDRDQLVLVTCYPFNALTAGGPLRYVVIATPII